MRIIFVRHGHPNYADDCLTDLGKVQAQACAERLKNRGIKKIYASTCGRAFETAQATADKIGLDVIPLEFMRELHWGAKSPDLDVFHSGHPWDTAEELFENQSVDLTTPAWRDHPYFRDNIVIESVEKVQNGFVDLMSDLGYTYKDGKWFCERENNDTVALFSHGGAGSAAMAKLLGWEFPYACLVIGMNYTSITVIDVPSRVGKFSLPRIDKINDDAHVTTTKVVFEM